MKKGRKEGSIDRLTKERGKNGGKAKLRRKRRKELKTQEIKAEKKVGSYAFGKDER